MNKSKNYLMQEICSKDEAERILSYLFSYEFSQEELSQIAGGGCSTTIEATWDPRGGPDAQGYLI